MAAILKETVRGVERIPLEDELLMKRMIFLTDEVNERTSDELIKELLYLGESDPEEPVTLLINSPGGEVQSGLAVYDLIRLMKSPVNTVCIGRAYSMAAILFLSGEKRLMLPHTEIMIHDPSYSNANIGGQKPHEIQRKIDSLNETRMITDRIIAERTGKPLQEILKLTQEDTYYKAEAAVEYGIATGIITEDMLQDGTFTL